MEGTPGAWQGLVLMVLSSHLEPDCLDLNPGPATMNLVTLASHSTSVPASPRGNVAVNLTYVWGCGKNKTC